MTLDLGKWPMEENLDLAEEFGERKLFWLDGLKVILVSDEEVEAHWREGRVVKSKEEEKGRVELAVVD